MGYYFRRLLIVLGWVICPVCGSDLITVRGFEGYNQRYECRNCGTITRVW
jgi:transposase-like protein